MDGPRWGADRYPAGYRVLVVGAGGGIGNAVARRLIERSARVVTADLTAPLEAAGLTPAAGFSVDVANADSVAEMVRGCLDLLGGLDAVVNCAGVLGRVRPTHELTVDEFDRVLRVNLTGCFAVSHAALPPMLDAGYGRIVHFASIAGKDGNPGMSAYSASKAGILGLVKAMGKEYATSGVTVNAIAPAIIETPLLAGMTTKRRDAQRKLVPMDRMGTAAEAAALVEYVISPEASFTTGFVFDLSGGRASY